MSERRMDPRVSFPVLVLFRAEPETPFISAYGSDLSVSGIRISGGGVREGLLVDLQLIERDGRRPLEVLGEVVRVDEEAFAVRFVELDDAQREWLSAVVGDRAKVESAPPPTEDLMVLGFDEL